MSKRRTWRWALGLMTAGILGVALAACEKSGDQAAGSGSAATSAATASGGGQAGTMYLALDADPTTMNPITAQDLYSQIVQGWVFSTLLTHDDDTYEWIPQLAEKWEISKDGKEFTFVLREGVKWQDGKPLTAEDVKYSFDVFFEGRFNAPHMKVYLENLKEVKIVDARTVKFITKDLYFKNFETAATLFIIPKHIYGVGDPNDPKFNKEIIGTGPYMLGEWEKGQKLVLKKNPDFFGTNLPYYKERNHFDRIFYRIVKEEAVALELLKKGDLDFIALTPEQYMQKAQGPEWGPGKKVSTVKTENSASDNFSYGFIGWNNQHPIFKDRNVRLAMSHLMNRDFMNEKFRFNLSEPASGPFGNKNDVSSPSVKPVPFDPKKALQILEKAGWKMGDKGLSKKIEGKDTPFEFTLMGANPDFEKYLTVIKEDMKKVGVTMNIKFLEWNSFVKLLDERKFEAVNLAWSASLDPDPKQIWHSASIPSPGSNFVQYSSPEVDKLIDQGRAEMDRAKRIPILRKIHELIAEDQPYSFFFNRKFVLYGNTNRLKKIKDTFKYAIGSDTWRIEK